MAQVHKWKISQNLGGPGTKDIGVFELTRERMKGVLQGLAIRGLDPIDIENRHPWAVESVGSHKAEIWTCGSGCHPNQFDAIRVAD